MDYKELISTPEWQAYQDALADVIAGFLHDRIFKDGASAGELRAAFDLAREVLSMPKQLIRDDDFNRRFDERLRDRFMSIPRHILLREMYGDQ